MNCSSGRLNEEGVSTEPELTLHVLKNRLRHRGSGRRSSFGTALARGIAHPRTIRRSKRVAPSPLALSPVHDDHSDRHDSDHGSNCLAKWLHLETLRGDVVEQVLGGSDHRICGFREPPGPRYPRFCQTQGRSVFCEDSPLDRESNATIGSITKARAGRRNEAD